MESSSSDSGIKAVLEANKEAQAISYLHAYILKKESEIENICNWNYEPFVQAVDELLKVREETSKLKSSILQINEGFQSSGKEALSKVNTDLFSGTQS